MHLPFQTTELSELLERYRDDPRVMNITGYNPLTHGVGDGSYYPSRFFHCWGWATWRRVERLYEYDMASYPAFRDDGGTPKTEGNPVGCGSQINVDRNR